MSDFTEEYRVLKYASNLDDFKLSVIVTVFNASDHLSVCIDSLISQDLQDMELVIVNDGSPDQVDDDLINGYLEIFDNITYVKLCRNIGTSIARKIGWTVARGDYIGFLDADDYARSDAYSLLYSAAREFEADISVGNFIATHKHGDMSIPSSFPSSGVKRVFSGASFFDCQLNRRYIPFYPRIDWWNKIYKRDLLLKMDQNIPAVVRNEGVFSMLASLISKSCVVVDEPLFFSYIREGSVCRVFRDRNIDDTINSYNHFSNQLKSIGIYEKYENSFDDLFIYVIFNHNLQKIIQLTKEERNNKIELLCSKLFKGDDLEYRINKYLLRSRNPDELIAHAALKGTRVYRQLARIKNTNLEKGRHGGTRLFHRPRMLQKDTVSVVTVSRDIISSERLDLFYQAVDSVHTEREAGVNVEQVVIDGESADDSISVYASLASEGKIDYWVSEPDNGIFDAMNKAPYFALGEYCLFLNTDDYLLPGSLSALIQKAVDENADYVYADAIKVNEKNEIVGRHIADMDKVFFGSPYCHQAVLCKTDLLREVKFQPDYRLTMWPFAFDLMMAGYKGVYLRQNVAAFRVGGASTVTDFDAFTSEQDRFKKDQIIPKINLSYNEYEYINHYFRKWNTDGMVVNKDDIKKKLCTPINQFQVQFSESANRLLKRSGFYN